jgi:hypothetical protein
MKALFLLLLLLLPGWVYAADGDAQNAFVKLTEEESIEFARARGYPEFNRMGPY